jgi:hypothetical protein
MWTSNGQKILMWRRADHQPVSASGKFFGEMENLVLITNLCLWKRGKLSIEPLPGTQELTSWRKAKYGADPGNQEMKHSSAQMRQSGVDQSLCGTEEVIRGKANLLLNPCLETKRFS